MIIESELLQVRADEDSTHPYNSRGFYFCTMVLFGPEKQ